MEHARLSPSSGDRWFVCPGSVQASAGYPDKQSVYAAEGVRAHDMLEAALLLDVEPEALINPEIEEHMEMAEGIGHAIDYLRSYLELNPGADYHPETRLFWGASVGYPDQFGTGDLLITAPDELVMGDLKYGKGIVVEVVDNIQLRLYMLGAREKFGRRDRYRIVVFQPRARHAGGPVREELLTNDELDAFQVRAKAAADATYLPDAPRTAGSHCRFCPAAGSCSTLAEYSLRVAAEEFGVADALSGAKISPSLPQMLSGADIAALLAQVPIVDAWMKALSAEAFGRQQRGDKIPGYKLVLGRSSRHWTDEDAAKLALVLAGVGIDEVAPRSIVSPAGAERLMKLYKLSSEEKIEVLVNVEKRPGNLTFARESDPRPEHIPFSEFSESPNE